MFNAQTPPYCYHWYAVFLKGQRRAPGDKVLPSNVCIENFDFHNRRNSRNITGTDPRNRSILKHAWYPFRFPMRTSGIIIFLPWMANSYYSLHRSRFFGLRYIPKTAARETGKFLDFVWGGTLELPNDPRWGRKKRATGSLSYQSLS